MNRSGTLVVLLLVLLPLCLLGATVQTLADYKAIYVQETEKIQANNATTEEIATAYLKALDRAESDFKKAGDFPGTKAVREERKRFGLVNAVPEETPTEVPAAIAGAQTAFRSSIAGLTTDRNERLIKLSQRYVKALRKHTATLLEQNKMEEAEVVNKEIESVTALEQALSATLSAKVDPEPPPPVNKSAKSTDGLVCRYPFNGNAANVVSDDYQGLVNGAVLTADRFGRARQAYYFNGEGAYISLGNGNPIKNNQGTMAAWIKSETRQHEYNGYIVVKGNDAAVGGSYAIHTYSQDGSAQKAQACTMTGAGGIVWAASLQQLMQEGKWHHVVGVIDGNKVSVYVDGKLAGSNTFSGQIPETDRPLWIGGQARGGYGYFFKGSIDDVAIYDRPLSEVEIKKLYRSQR